MPADVTGDEVGCPDDGHGQAPPTQQIRAMDEAHKRILEQWATMRDKSPWDKP